MNPGSFFVLLASIAFASPFHKGASWEWMIIDPDSAAPLHRIAQVVDSLSDSAKGDWVLRIADSVNQRDWEMARLYEYSPGKGYWLDCSLRLPLEPRAFDPRIDRFDTTNTWMDEFRPWGVSCLLLNSNGNSTRPFQKYFDGFDFQQDRFKLWLQWGVLEGWGVDTVAIPDLPWDSSLGWTRAKWWKPNMSMGFARMRGPLQEWILVAKDGQKLTEEDIGKGKTGHVPPPGSVREWEWKEHFQWESGYLNPAQPSRASRDSASTIRLRWEFMDRPSDSSGWIRALVRETRTVDLDTSIASMLSLRWNPASGERRSTNSVPSDKMADGFWEDWADYRTDSGSIRRSKELTSNTARGGGWSSAYGEDHASYREIRFAGGIDSMYEYDDLESSGSSSFNSQSVTRTVRLLQIDGTVLRQPTPAVGVIYANRTVIRSTDLKNLAVRFPTSKVVVRDLLGKIDVAPLREFVLTRPLHGLGVRFWEVRLPDGSIHRGTTIE